MRWIQAGRRQGYRLVGPSPTAGIAAQTRLTSYYPPPCPNRGGAKPKCMGPTTIWARGGIVGIWDEDLFYFCFFNFLNPPVHMLHNISARLNGVRQGYSGAAQARHHPNIDPSRPQSRYILIDHSETLELTTIVASNHIIDRCFSRHLIRSKFPSDLHAAIYEHGEGHGGVVPVTLKGLQF
jgi:hypothetical protein